MSRQSEHDQAVNAAGEIYRKNGKKVWVNPGSEKNKAWGEKYVDVIVPSDKSEQSAWLIEIETKESVSEHEAERQWKDYSERYEHWYLAVPKGTNTQAKLILTRNEIKNCTVIIWTKDAKGIHTFWNLPGLK